MWKKLLVICLIIFVLSGCKKEEESVPVLMEPVSAEVSTAVATRGDIYNLITYDAKVYPEIHEVSFEVDGRVKDLYAYLGQEVEEGELLMRYDDKHLLDTLSNLEKQRDETIDRNEYDIKQLNLDIQLLNLNLEEKEDTEEGYLARIQLESEIHRLELRKQQMIEMHEYNTEQLNMKIEEVKEELSRYDLMAPSSGTIAYVNYVSMDQSVSTEDIMVVIADTTKLYVQSEYINPTVINNASRVFARIGEREYDVEYIPLTSDEAMRMKNGTTGIESRYNIEQDVDIQSGDYASICLQDKLKTDVITIPKNALYREARGNFVYRMTEGTLERVDVEVGLETNTQIEILSGLEEGDVVYVQG